MKGRDVVEPGKEKYAYRECTKDSAKRKKLVESMKSFLNRYPFDGIEIAWNYPIGNIDA